MDLVHFLAKELPLVVRARERESRAEQGTASHAMCATPIRSRVVSSSCSHPNFISYEPPTPKHTGRTLPIQFLQTLGRDARRGPDTRLSDDAGAGPEGAGERGVAGKGGGGSAGAGEVVIFWGMVGLGLCGWGLGLGFGISRRHTPLRCTKRNDENSWPCSSIIPRNIRKATAAQAAAVSHSASSRSCRPPCRRSSSRYNMKKKDQDLTEVNLCMVV